MHRSLRLRLLAGSLVWILAAVAITGVLLADLFGQHVRERVDAELHGHLDQLTALFEIAPDGTATLRMPLSDPRLSRPYAGLYWQVDGGPAGTIGLLRSRSLWDTALSVPPDTLADGEVHVHDVDGPDASRVRLMERLIRPAEQPDTAYRLIVALDTRQIHEPVEEFATLLAIALGVLALGLGAAAVLQVGIGLAPLGRMRQALGAVRDGHTRRLEGDYPREVQPLVDELNTLLAHDEAMVERARTQAGNLAHAVKTPLTILANAARNDPSELARLVDEQVGDARRQVDYHLARARAAVAVQQPGLRTPLRPVLDGLIRVMRRLHAERDLHIAMADVADTLACRGDAQDLQEILGNLLDNACKWAARQVSITAATADGQLVVHIDDDGPGLDEAQRSAVLARGVRADEHTPGSGLGLAIAHELARVYGGDLRLDISPLGGLRATLTMPSA
ncbi:sensor histidine kinase [Denitromonas sp. IR12]|uniref:histidine kinase n=2 Tax=Denitromonas iodatirespirans TaxID=2795389 RepID=A0A944DHA3_DENI1|nr:sensor histidine kinase [Denitromonas iodatirespirans]